MVVLLRFVGGVVVFLWWRGCVFVVVSLCFCDCVGCAFVFFVVVSLCLCFCVFVVVWLCFCVFVVVLL